MSRLAELGSQSLSDDPETVDQLLELVKANLPFKVLGLTLRQNDQSLVHLVDALSGTPTPAVRKALEEIVAKFPGQGRGPHRDPCDPRRGTDLRRRPNRAPPERDRARLRGRRSTGCSGGEPAGRSRRLRAAVAAAEPRGLLGFGNA